MSAQFRKLPEPSGMQQEHPQQYDLTFTSGHGQGQTPCLHRDELYTTADGELYVVNAVKTVEKTVEKTDPGSPLGRRDLRNNMGKQSQP